MNLPDHITRQQITDAFAVFGLDASEILAGTGAAGGTGMSYHSTTVVHDETERCNGTHCHSCGLDEMGSAFEWCGECGHGYRTEHDLIAAYRKGLLETLHWSPPWFRSTELNASTVAILWRWLATRDRSDQITFCPLCMHDF